MAWRICGTASHQRWHIGKSGVRAWAGGEGQPVWDEHGVPGWIQQDLHELANPALRLGPTWLPTVDSLHKFLARLECASGGIPTAAHASLLTELLDGWGGPAGLAERSFLNAFIRVPPKQQDMVELATFYKNLKPGTGFEPWAKAVLDLPKQCDVVLGLLVVGGVPGDVVAALCMGPTSRCALRQLGTAVRTDPAALALQAARRGPSVSSVVAAAIRVLQWHPGTAYCSGQPYRLTDQYQRRLLGALTLADTMHFRNAGAAGVMRQYGCVKFPNGLTQRMRANSWAIHYVNDDHADIPDEALDSLFVAVGSKLYSCAMLSVLKALFENTLRVALYPTLEPGRPRVIQHAYAGQAAKPGATGAETVRCNWVGNLTAPRVAMTSRRAISVLADDTQHLTWGALHHAHQLGVTDVVIAGHHRTIVCNHRAPSVWTDLFHFGGWLRLFGVSVRTNLLDVGFASKELTKDDYDLVRTQTVLAMTHDYDCIGPVIEVATRGLPRPPVSKHQVAFSTAVDLAQLMAVAEAPVAPAKGCKRAGDASGDGASSEGDKRAKTAATALD